LAALTPGPPDTAAGPGAAEVLRAPARLQGVRGSNDPKLLSGSCRDRLWNCAAAGCPADVRISSQLLPLPDCQRASEPRHPCRDAARFDLGLDAGDSRKIHRLLIDQESPLAW